MKKQYRLMKKLLAFVLAVTLMALQTGLPVYAEEMPGSEQGVQTGDIAVPEQEQGAQTGDIAVPEPEQGAQTGDIPAPETEKVPSLEEPADAGEKAKEPGSSEGGEKPVPEEEGLQEEAVSAVSGQEIPEVEKPEPGKAAGSEASEIEEPAGDGDTGEVEVDSWNGLQEAFNNASVNSESPTRITLSGNVAMPEEIKIDQKIFGTNLVVPAGKYVVLDLKGHTIDRKLGDRPYVFGEYSEIMEVMNVITVSGNLTLEDSSDENTGKITGGYGNPAGGVTVTSGASFTMKGGRITGNRACCAYGHYVGGVYVAERAQFLMEGGSIDDNKNADGSAGAGGVFVSGSFTMSGNSSITNNNADIVGTGGVKVYGQGASFTMKGGTIKGNHSGDGQGGGVYVFNGTFEMNDGAIEGNESKKASFGGGGGVCVNGSAATFTMRGGRINGNKLSVTDTYDRCGGGGVLVSDGTFTMEGGSISGNKVDVKGKNSGGGGVYACSGTFNMKSGSITGNSVTGSAEQCGGGGVLINNGGTFTMEDGTITGNTANVTGSESGGGGVYSGGGFFTMEGGSITGNTANVTGAESGGGGVYSGHGIFTMQGGSITGNNVSGEASRGGGVYVCPHGNPMYEKFELSGTPIIRANVKGGNLSGEVYTGGTTSNVWLYSDEEKEAVIYDVSGLSDGAEIWVGTESGSKAITDYVSEGSVKYLHADDDRLLAVFEDGYIYLREKTTWSWLQGKFNAASESEASPTKICMNYDAVAGESDSFLYVPAGKYVKLDLNGFKIDRGLAGRAADYSGSGNVITVSGNLTLTDSSDKSDTPEYDGTGILTGGNNIGKAGGVQVSGGGVFSMKGGRIALNLTVGIGGVWVSENGMFRMTGGEITQNVGRAGGGVGFEGSSFELGGDPKIFGNVKGGVIQYGEIKDGKTNNVNVYSGKTISINGVMTNTTPVGVTTVPEPTGGKPVIFTSNWSGVSPGSYFASDNEKYSVVMQDGEAALVDHVHKLTYSAKGGTITAVCSGDKNCGFPNHTATLTIEAPEHRVYADGASPEAQISDDYQIQGTASVSYYKADPSGSRSGEALAVAPTDAGKYRAEITLGEGAGSATAYVVYEIEKAVPVYIIPTGLAAVYGQTLEDVKLPESSNGEWTWADEKASVGDAGEKTFKGVFTPEDKDNYKTVTVDVAVNVAKADYTRTSLSANQRYGTKGMIELKDYIPEGGETGEVTAGGDKEVLSGNAVAKDKVLSCVLKDSRDYVGKKVVFTIPVRSCKNYKDYSLTVTLTVADCSHTSTELRHVLKATCMEKGYSGDLCCKDCNALIKKGEETPVDPENHDFDMEKGKITTEPNYLSYGAHTYYCRRNTEHTLVLWNIEPLPAPDGKNYGDLAEDTRGLSENAAPKVETKNDEKGNEVTTVSINGAEVEQVVKDPESGKETVKSLVWIGGLKESYRYTGAAIKPEFHVYDGTNKLTEKTDYTVSFKKNKDVGTGEITVKFKGNYGDTKPRTLNFEIKPAILGEDIIAHETGVTVKKSAQKPVPVLTWASTGKTVAAKDFNIIYDPAEVKDAGTYTATITPKKEGGNFDGRTTALVKVAAKDKVLSNVKVRFDPASYPYSGKPVEPKYTLTMGTTTLTEGTDFECVSLTGNINPGTATIIFEAIDGNPSEYVGSRTATFKITGKKSLTDEAVSVACAESAPFAKGGAKAAVTVTDKDTNTTLKEGVDYTLSYAKNKALGTEATVKVKGKGNYKDTVTKTFTVTKQSLKEEGISIIVADQFTTKSKLKAPSVTITDIDGKKLSAKTDYTVGEPDLSAKDNTEENGVVYITITGKGNYSETESVKASFRYTKETASNISRAKTKTIQAQTYTGNAVKLSKPDLTDIVYTGSKGSENYLKPGIDFEVIDSTYTNNVKKGTAKVKVKGLGAYAGMKTLSFKIEQRKVDYKGALVGDDWK